MASPIDVVVLRSIVHVEKAVKVEEILRVLREFYAQGIQVMGKQQVLERLYKKILKVLDLVEKYLTLENKSEPWLDENKSMLCRHSELYKEVQCISDRVNTFRMKIDNAHKNITDFIEKMDGGILELHESFKRAVDAQNIEILSGVSIPTLESPEIIPDPKVEELVAEWGKMQLVSRMTYIYQHVKEIYRTKKQYFVDVHRIQDDEL